MSSKVSCGFRPKNLRNSLKDPKFHALPCFSPSIDIALMHFGILLAPKAPNLMLELSTPIVVN